MLVIHEMSQVPVSIPELPSDIAGPGLSIISFNASKFIECHTYYPQPDRSEMMHVNGLNSAQYIYEGWVV